MLMIFFRALVLYVIVVLFMRLMGKRQIGQLEPFELVITLMVADLVAMPMQDIGVPIIEGIIPMLALFAIHNVISLLSVRVPFLRVLFCGKPSVLIDHGIIHEKELKKLNISVLELMEGLRVKGVPDVSDVYRAMLETNGSMSVIVKKEAQPVIAREEGAKVQADSLPMTLITDGKYDENNMRVLNITRANLDSALVSIGIHNAKDIFVALSDEAGTLWVQQRNAQKMQKGKVRRGA